MACSFSFGSLWTKAGLIQEDGEPGVQLTFGGAMFEVFGVDLIRKDT